MNLAFGMAVGFILFCSLIAKFVIAPLDKKYPTTMKTFMFADTIRWLIRL